MAENDILGGHKFSLRAKTSDQIKRINWISNSLGSIGEFLVSTWGGIMMGIVTLGGTAMLITDAVMANSFQTVFQNIVPIILMAVGGLLIAVNVIMTNPSSGSQFFISLQFLINKFNNHAASKKIQDVRPFRFLDSDENKEVIEVEYKRKKRYMVVYSVQGLVSPTTFDEDLKMLAVMDKQLLSSFERDTVLTTINSIQRNKVVRKNIASNATQGMKNMRDLQYKITSELPHNQQLQTIMIVNAPNLDVLRSRLKSFEIAMNNGLVIGYLRLRGRQAKDVIKDIYG